MHNAQAASLLLRGHGVRPCPTPATFSALHSARRRLLVSLPACPATFLGHCGAGSECEREAWKRRRAQLNRRGYAAGRGVGPMETQESVGRHIWVRTDGNAVALIFVTDRHKGHTAQDASNKTRLAYNDLATQYSQRRAHHLTPKNSCPSNYRMAGCVQPAAR